MLIGKCRCRWNEFLWAKENRSGGRTWWAHFEFTRINIAPTILRKKIEDLHEVGARPRSRVRRHRSMSSRAPTVLRTKMEDLREVSTSMSIASFRTTSMSLPGCAKNGRFEADYRP